jgi:hypothetical protein
LDPFCHLDCKVLRCQMYSWTKFKFFKPKIWLRFYSQKGKICYFAQFCSTNVIVDQICVLFCNLESKNETLDSKFWIWSFKGTFHTNSNSEWRSLTKFVMWDKFKCVVTYTITVKKIWIFLLLLACLISPHIWNIKFHTETDAKSRQSCEDSCNFAASIFMETCQKVCTENL